MSGLMEAAPAIANTAGGVIGLIAAGAQDRRQVRQQKKLQDLQIKGQKEMGEYNQALAYDLWEKTNYDAQRKQMEKAGLNVGLMYGMGGGGGVTANTPTGNVSSATAQGGVNEWGMGMELGMKAAQLSLLKAQKENIDADTANKMKTVPKTEAETGESVARKGEIEARTENIKQLTSNAKVQQNILNWDERLKSIEANVANMTQQDVIQKIAFEAKKINAEMESAVLNKEILRETADEIIKQTEQSTVEQQLRMGAIKAGVVKTEQEVKNLQMGITKMASEVMNMTTERLQSWNKLNLYEREVIVKEMMQKVGQEQMEFNTSDAAKIRQWTGVVSDIVGAATSVGTMGGTMGGRTVIKGFGN